VEDFTRMRVKNVGGRFVMMLVEFAYNVFLPDQFRAHPTLQELSDAAATHVAYVNDIVAELEKKLSGLQAEPEAFAVRTYVDGVKSLMAGNFHWHTVDKRYRHPDSVFPELRRITN
jgi:hypothetical protein